MAFRRRPSSIPISRRSSAESGRMCRFSRTIAVRRWPLRMSRVVVRHGYSRMRDLGTPVVVMYKLSPAVLRRPPACAADIRPREHHSGKAESSPSFSRMK